MTKHMSEGGGRLTLAHKKLFAILAVAMMMCTVLCIVDTTDGADTKNKTNGEPLVITENTTLKDLETAFGAGTVGWKYDESTTEGTLTLKQGASFACEFKDVVESVTAITCEGVKLTIELDDCNVKIAVSGYQGHGGASYYDVSGICSDNSLKITGKGTLTIDMSEFNGTMAKLHCVWLDYGNNANLDVTDGAKLVCDSQGKRVTEVTESYGIECYLLAVNKAEVKIVCANASYSCGIYTEQGNTYEAESSKIDITTNGSEKNIGINCSNFIMKNSDVNITIGRDGTDESYGIFGNNNNCAIVIGYSDLTIDGTNVSTGKFYGAYAPNYINIYNSIIKVTGDSNNNFAYGLGAYSNGVSVLGDGGSNIAISVGNYAIYKGNDTPSGVTDFYAWQCKVYGNDAEITGSEDRFDVSTYKKVDVKPSDGKDFFAVKFDLGKYGNATPVVAPTKEKATMPSADDATRPGATLKKWTDTETDTDYTPGSEYSFTSTITLHAVWSHTVEYYDGTTVIKTETKDDGEQITLEDALTKEGYNFKGWSDGKTTYDAKSTYKVEWNVKFVAVWSAVVPELTVTSPSSGTTVDTENVDVTGTTTGATVAIKVNGTDAGTVTVESGAFTKTVTLQEGENTIEITATGATGGMATKTITVTYDAGSDPTPGGGSGFDGNIVALMLLILVIIAVAALYLKRD